MLPFILKGLFFFYVAKLQTASIQQVHALEQTAVSLRLPGQSLSLETTSHMNKLWNRKAAPSPCAGHHTQLAAGETLKHTTLRFIRLPLWRRAAPHSSPFFPNFSHAHAFNFYHGVEVETHVRAALSLFGGNLWATFASCEVWMEGGASQVSGCSRDLLPGRLRADGSL